MQVKRRGERFQKWHLGHFVAVRNFVPNFSTVVACYHNLEWVKVKTMQVGVTGVYLFAHFWVHVRRARQFKPWMSICALWP